MTESDPTEPVAKKARIDDVEAAPAAEVPSAYGQIGRIKGFAQIKPEFIIEKSLSKVDPNEEFDDENEGRPAQGGGDRGDRNDKRKDRKKGGQNKNRKLIQGKDVVKFCEQIKMTGDPADCKFGENCRFEHDISKYIASKPKDIEGMCPVAEAIGICPAGVKCRWLSAHFTDNKVVVDQVKHDEAIKTNREVNKVNSDMQNDLQRKRFNFVKSEEYIAYLDSTIRDPPITGEEGAREDRKEAEAAYSEAPFKPLEKKKLYLNRAKILSPLTTVGNLPYRRLMKTLGTDVTYSEMALSLPLIQGNKSEWALPRAHSSEVGGFAVQIAASKYWQATKAAEAIANYCPDTSEINLNCGCPIDLLYRQGAGSALLDNPARLLRMLRGMNAVSNDIPVTVKIRTGTRDAHPTAKTLVNRVIDEGQAAAIILHGRSRAQRYAKLADWEYIKGVAEVVKARRETVEDKGEESVVRPWIIGNGDVYSYKDWYDDIENSGVDSVMVARGALIRPWIFEEVDAQQYLDKSATERLELIKRYAHYGLEHWGADEYGVNLTRRFLCEWLSFTHRYVPVGLLEYLPPKINDRPPPWKGRNELETLLASSDYRDWIKISEMFLGPVTEGFDFTPKHKSNAY